MQLCEPSCRELKRPTSEILRWQRCVDINLGQLLPLAIDIAPELQFRVTHHHLDLCGDFVVLGFPWYDSRMLPDEASFDPERDGHEHMNIYVGISTAKAREGRNRCE
jgi:hypothetical protein